MNQLPSSRALMVDLNAARAIGYHLVNRARENGEDMSKPLIFVGSITAMMGITMMSKGLSQSQRGR